MAKGRREPIEPTEEEQAQQDYESYASLADEMNDDSPHVGPWVESDWDAQAVKEGKRYAEKHGLRWPPGTGDFDRLYDREQNPQDYPDINV